MKLNKYAVFGVLVALVSSQAEAKQNTTQKKLDFAVAILHGLPDLAKITSSESFKALVKQHQMIDTQLGAMGLLNLQETPVSLASVSVIHIKMIDPGLWDVVASSTVYSRVYSRTVGDFFVFTLDDGRKIGGYTMNAITGQSAADFADFKTKEGAVKDGAPAEALTFNYDPAKGVYINKIDASSDAALKAALDLMIKEGCTIYYGPIPKGAKWKANLDVRDMSDTETFFPKPKEEQKDQ